MQRHWSKQELETYWSFSSDELTLIPDRDASSRLGVAASLKFLQLEGFFPSSVKDIPSVAIDHMAKLLDVDPDAISDYDWQGRTGTRYRGRLRTALVISFVPYAARDRAYSGSSSFSASSGVNRGMGKMPASWRASRQAHTTSSWLGATFCLYQGR
jgi:hypothetical protein